MTTGTDTPIAPQRLIVGITGASGSLYGIRLLQLLRDTEVETHLVLSRSAETALSVETEWKADAVRALADQSYGAENIGAAIASGSFRTMGMIIAPCSMHSLASIASGVTGNLLTRAADVTLKERRRLLLMTRETPLHLGHLRNMASVTEMGAVIFPPVPAFYARPGSIAEMVDHTLGRALDLFGIDLGTAHRWRE